MKPLHKISPQQSDNLKAVLWWFEQRKHIYEIELIGNELRYRAISVEPGYFKPWTTAKYNNYSWSGVWRAWKRKQQVLEISLLDQYT